MCTYPRGFHRVCPRRPTTEGLVGSAASDGSHSVITYSFELGRDTFGGATTLALNNLIPYSEGQRVTVA